MNKFPVKIILIFSLCVLTWSTTKNLEDSEDLPTVPYVDLTRYQGQWYEIVRIPQPFEENCICTEALYQLESNGSVLVNNTCYQNGLKGDLTVAIGQGQADDNTNSKLTINFGYVSGPYWILELANDYSWSLVGSPQFDALWILSRTPTLNADIVDGLIDYAESLGFPVSKLIHTVQDGCPLTNYPWYHDKTRYRIRYNQLILQN